MNYQNILCVGDSQTFGARTYGCYPLHLASLLTERTPYSWRAINFSHNGDRARELWFKLNPLLDQIHDTYQACILIGANDVAGGVDPELFEEYYRQILRAFVIKRYRALYCGEVPPLFPDGHVFFPKKAVAMRDAFNEVIRRVAAEVPHARVVTFSELTRASYEDPVHFNETGNRHVAEAFATAILAS